jgi:hypothetical protein
LSTAEQAAVGAVVDEMYAMISGPKGPRDWSRQTKAFTTDARQMRTGVDADGRAWIKTMSPADYARDVAGFFEANDFFEVEIARRIDVLGNMAQVWSLYEARTAPDDATPERRGVNSIQLYRDPDLGWRIVSMIWDNERLGVRVAPF